MTATIPDLHQHRHPIALREPDHDRLAVRRRIPDEDWTRYEGYAREILGAFGMDLTTAGTEATPRRFIRARTLDGSLAWQTNTK